MVGEYVIREDGQAVGTARAEKQGLYYVFSCRCRPAGRQMRRIIVRCGGADADLGLCVPMDGQFGTQKRIPCKQLPDGEPEFFLLPREKKTAGRFAAVYPEEPFSYMARLKDAFLQNRDGQLGIVIRE